MSHVSQQVSTEVSATNPFVYYSNLDLGSQATLTGGAIGTIVALKLLVDSLTRLVEELRK